MKKTLAYLAATAVGLGPGVLHPFVVAYLMQSGDSDTLLLAMSVSLFAVNIVVHAVEAHAVARFGESLGKGAPPSPGTLTRTARRGLMWSAPFVVVFTPLVLLVYSAGTAPSATLFQATAITVGIPIAGSFAAAYSGLLIAQGRAMLCILTQGFRSLLPALLLLVVPEIGILSVCAAAVAGELCRTAVLGLASRRAVDHCGEASGTVPDFRMNNLYWQFLSSTATQANPIVDRAFLVRSGTGFVTGYELADKISFSVFQLSYNVLLLRRLGSWAVLHGQSVAAGYRCFLADLAKLFGLTLVGASAAAAGIAAVTLWTNLVPESFRLGVQWSLISLFAMPFAICVTALIRYLVILESQRHLFIVTVAGVALNLACDAALYALLGSVGIPVASIITRAFLAGGMFVLVKRLVAARVEGESGN